MSPFKKARFVKKRAATAKGVVPKSVKRYVKHMIEEDLEHKHFLNAPVIRQNINSNGMIDSTVNNIDIIDAVVGAPTMSIQSRKGNQVRMKSLDIRGYWSWTPTALASTFSASCRFICGIWKKGELTSAPSQILDNSSLGSWNSPVAPYALATIGEYTILKDKTVEVNANIVGTVPTTPNATVPFHYRINLKNKMARWMADSGVFPTNNQLFFLMITNSSNAGAGDPAITYSTDLTFTDA